MVCIFDQKVHWRKPLQAYHKLDFCPLSLFSLFARKSWKKQEGLKDRKQQQILVTETGTLSSQLARVVYHFSVWASI